MGHIYIQKKSPCYHLTAAFNIKKEKDISHRHTDVIELAKTSGSEQSSMSLS
jgi:hypothetical protein